MVNVNLETNLGLVKIELWEGGARGPCRTQEGGFREKSVESGLWGGRRGRGSGGLRKGVRGHVILLPCPPA